MDDMTDTRKIGSRRRIDIDIDSDLIMIHIVRHMLRIIIDIIGGIGMHATTSVSMTTTTTLRDVVGAVVDDDDINSHD